MAETRLTEVQVDDDGITLCHPKGQVRIEMLADGWNVIAADQPTEPCTPEYYGLLHAGVVAKHYMRESRRRKRIYHPRGLFSFETHEIDFSQTGSRDRLIGIIAALWRRRGLSIRPELAALWGKRPANKDLVVAGALSFLRTPYLLEDALRFRGARVAMNDWFRLARQKWGAYPQTDSLVPQLSNWRALLYRGAGEIPRALHVTIDQLLPDEHSAETGDKWQSENLRRDEDIGRLSELPWRCPLKSELHLSFLSSVLHWWHRDTEARAAALRLLQEAPTSLLASTSDALVGVYPWLSARQEERIWEFARNLRHIPPEGKRAKDWLRQALVEVKNQLSSPRDRSNRSRAKTYPPPHRPPIPLLTFPGVTFLDTHEKIQEEGRRMHHCIGERIWKAARGKAYFFHVTFEGTHASVEVSDTGVVRQARGPCNQETRAAECGTAMLGRWGLGLLFGSLTGSYSRDAPLQTPPALPQGILEPLPTQGALLDALRQMRRAPRHVARFLRVAWKHYAEENGFFVSTGDDVILVDREGEVRVAIDDRCRVRVTKPGTLAKHMVNVKTCVDNHRLSPSAARLPGAELGFFSDA